MRFPTEAQALVDELLLRCSFPDSGRTLDCAVSGGPDSTAMLVLAVAAGCRVTAHHVDHGLRAESAAEAELVADLAERFGAEFRPHRVVLEPGGNLEARARTARRSALPPRVATGHTLDDRAETVLINLMRGAAGRGLAPLRPGPTKPIVRLRRAETHQLVTVLGLTIVDDPMNHDPTFVRTRVRHELLPLLDDIAGRDLAPVLTRQADLLATESDFLDATANHLDATDAVALAQADPVLARLAIRRFVEQHWQRPHPPSAASVDRVLEVARGHAVSTQIEGGHSIHRSGQRLRLEGPSLGCTST